MKKRLISLLLVLCLLFSMLPATVLADTWAAERGISLENPFNDVKAYDWYYDAVQYVRVNGIFTGLSDTSFGPGGYLSRAMFVTVLGRMAGVDPANYAGLTTFKDIPANAYYAPYVAWASQYGITDGTGEGVFSPDALVDRQQLATFIMRYFDAFGIKYYTDVLVSTEEPTDFHLVADWAKDSVRNMWQFGLLQGDGVAYDPTAKATRAQTATLCTRLDEAVEVWYSEPGVESTRVRIDPLTGKPYEDVSALPAVAVQFYDGDRLIDTLYTKAGLPLGEIPAVEKSSKEGAVLLGYYYDREFTKPFRADNLVFTNMRVFAKYRAMDSIEEHTVRAFTNTDAATDQTFIIQPIDGNMVGTDAAVKAVDLQSKDGSDPVALAAADNGNGTYTIYAPNGFNPNCAYELTLADGWIFTGKEDTIRTASFIINRDANGMEFPEVRNLEMGEDIVYIQDTPLIDYTVAGKNYDVLTSDVAALLYNETTDTYSQGSFEYSDGADISENDVLCIYVGTHPLERTMDGKDLMNPAIYVKATGYAGGTVTFTAIDAAARQEMYEVPDNFPIVVEELPTGNGTISLNKLDIPMYESMVGVTVGTMANAKEKLSTGDFVTLYISTLEKTIEGEPFYGRVTGFTDDGTGNITISYEKVERQTILDSMDLHVDIEVDVDDLITDEERYEMSLQVESQLERSGFAEEAGYMLAELVTASPEFRQDSYIRDWLLTDENGDPLPEDQIRLMGGGGFTIKDIDLDATVGEGSRFDGVQIAIDIHVNMEVEAEDGIIAMDLTASFTEEAMIAPGMNGSTIYKEVLGIPVPIGVHVTTNVDVLNFTAFSFAAELTTVADDGSILGVTSIASDFEELMNTADEAGLTDPYFQSLEALLDKYSEMLQKETDWIKLLEQEIFAIEYCVYGLAIGIEVDFVVRTDMSIAIGSSLEYQVGKRYSFWFKIGLFTPTAGSDTTDLLDEKFSYQFYVLGKLGIKAGAKAKIYVGLGSGKLASVGIAAELGPYVKLHGLFIYNYSRLRKAGSETYTTTSSMIGGLNMEFGLYLIMSFEAEVLDGLAKYSKDFFDEEYPLLQTTSPNKYYYGLYYAPQEENERVFIWDEDANSETGITMDLPEKLRALNYVDLYTGIRGTEVLDYSNFSVTLSNPNFTIDSNGKITVDKGEWDRYMECDITVTYLHGKSPFSKYDMTTTIPVVWTNLALSELKEYKTVSVMVGEDGKYEEVWTKRVLKGQSFDLPSDAELQELIGWNYLKYDTTSGYYHDGRGNVLTNLTDLTVINDTTYYYDVDYKTYYITVGGIQNRDGTEAAPRVYTALYGETFNFFSGTQNLFDTYTDDPANEKFTRFKNVTTTSVIPTEVTYDTDTDTFAVVDQAIDLTQPITGEMAKALYYNTGSVGSDPVKATANYVDDSVTAVFTFNGLSHDLEEDVIVKVRRGTAPAKGVAKVEAIIEAGVKDAEGAPVAISDFYPSEKDPIYTATNYVVTCVGLTGDRRLVTFVSEGYTHTGCEEPLSGYTHIGCTASEETGCYHFYYQPERDGPVVDKMVGALIVNIPDPDRRGWTFKDWYAWTEEGQKSYNRVMPENGITLYAEYEPNNYLVDFNMNGVRHAEDVLTPEDMVVTYDTPYGDGYAYSGTTDRVTGKAPVYGTSGDYTYTDINGNVFDGLPVLNFTEDQGFLGWSTHPYRFDEPTSASVDNPAEVHVTNDTIAHIHADFGALQDNGKDIDLNTRTYGHVLYAQWKDRVDVNKDHKQKNIFSVSSATKTWVYDGDSHKVQIVIDPNDTYRHDTYENDKNHNPLYKNYSDVFADINDPDGSFTIQYKRHGVAGEWKDTITHAGRYDVRIQREGDNDYLPIDIFLENAVHVTKADCTLDASGFDVDRDVDLFYANLLASDSYLSAYHNLGSSVSDIGMGDFEFAISDSKPAADSNKWTSGPIYNIGEGLDGTSYKLWVRVGPGVNFNASDAVSYNITLTNKPGNLTYRLVVNTGNMNYAGTDSTIKIAFGGGTPFTLDPSKCLNGCKDCFEEDGEDEFVIPNNLITSDSGSIGFELTKDTSGDNEGWNLEWLRLDLYEGNTRLSVNDAEYNHTERDGWLERKDDVDYLTAAGVLKFGRIDNSCTVDKTNTTYYVIPTASDAYEHYNAPEFEAYFSEDGFDDLITWYFDETDQSWTASYSHDAVIARMTELEYYSLTFYYGVFDHQNYHGYDTTITRTASEDN